MAKEQLTKLIKKYGTKYAKKAAYFFEMNEYKDEVPKKNQAKFCIENEFLWLDRKVNLQY